MSIPFVCPRCGRKGQAADSLAGKSTRCRCGAKLSVAQGASSLPSPNRSAGRSGHGIPPVYLIAGVASAVIAVGLLLWLGQREAPTPKPPSATAPPPIPPTETPLQRDWKELKAFLDENGKDPAACRRKLEDARARFTGTSLEREHSGLVERVEASLREQAGRLFEERVSRARACMERSRYGEALQALTDLPPEDDPPGEWNRRLVAERERASSRAAAEWKGYVADVGMLLRQGKLEMAHRRAEAGLSFGIPSIEAEAAKLVSEIDKAAAAAARKEAEEKRRAEEAKQHESDARTHGEADLVLRSDELLSGYLRAHPPSVRGSGTGCPTCWGGRVACPLCGPSGRNDKACLLCRGGGTMACPACSPPLQLPDYILVSETYLELPGPKDLDWARVPLPNEHLLGYAKAPSVRIALAIEAADSPIGDSLATHGLGFSWYWQGSKVLACGRVRLRGSPALVAELEVPMTDPKGGAKATVRGLALVVDTGKLVCSYFLWPESDDRVADWDDTERAYAIAMLFGFSWGPKEKGLEVPVLPPPAGPRPEKADEIIGLFRALVLAGRAEEALLMLTKDPPPSLPAWVRRFYEAEAQLALDRGPAALTVLAGVEAPPEAKRALAYARAEAICRGGDAEKARVDLPPPSGAHEVSIWLQVQERRLDAPNADCAKVAADLGALSEEDRGTSEAGLLLARCLVPKKDWKAIAALESTGYETVSPAYYQAMCAAFQKLSNWEKLWSNSKEAIGYFPSERKRFVRYVYEAFEHLPPEKQKEEMGSGEEHVTLDTSVGPVMFSAHVPLSPGWRLTHTNDKDGAPLLELWSRDGSVYASHLSFMTGDIDKLREFTRTWIARNYDGVKMKTGVMQHMGGVLFETAFTGIPRGGRAIREIDIRVAQGGILFALMFEGTAGSLEANDEEIKWFCLHARVGKG